MRHSGRQRIEINPGTFEQLCRIQCTLDEIAAVLEVTPRTLERWCQREYGKPFKDVFEEKRLAGRASLRRMQWLLAEKSTAMAIFLGKNYLSQNDRQDLKLSGTVNVNTIADLMLEVADGLYSNSDGPAADR